MENSKRIMLITRNLAMGGIQKLIVDISEHLAAQGHEVHVVYMKRPLLLKPNKNVHLHFLNINKINRLSIIGFIYDIFARLVLRAIFPKSTFIWRGIYGTIIFKVFLYRLEKKVGRFDSIIARGQGAFEHIWLFNQKNYYQFIESPLPETDKGFLKKRYAKARFSNKNTIAISSGIFNGAKNYFDMFDIQPRSLQKITNPLPIKKIKTLADTLMKVPDAPYIINVARFCPQKNQLLLINAFAQANIPHKLVLVGAGPDKNKIIKLISQLNLDNRVILTGEVKNPYPLMKNADLFVLSSMYEGFGLVLVESLACGTPIVSVECPGGIRDIMIEELEQNISEYNSTALANKIEYALNNPLPIKESWYMRFDINKVANKFLEL